MEIRPIPRIAGEPQNAAHEVAGVLGQSGISDFLDSARLPMALIEGAEQVVCYVNPSFCHLAGKARDQIIGMPFAAVLPEGDQCLLLLDRVYRTGKTESHVEPEDTEPHSLYWSYDIWPVQAGQDHLAGVMIQVTETAPFHRRSTAINEALLLAAVRQHELMEVADTLNTQLQAEMKERKRVQDALLRSELLASAGRMAASIAHEINNPLEAVMNTLYLARTSDSVPEPVHEYLDIADGELLRVAHIVRQTLGFYREFSEPTSNSIAALMASVVDLLQAKIKSAGVIVAQRCDEDLRVMGVSGELRQVLANLLANSLDAVERGGRIIMQASVSLDPNDVRRRVRITVADSGHGMGASTLKEIFEPFFSTKGSVGTGLGLWVCKQLVDKNGGSIRVRSNPDGEREGTTFSVLLPEGATLPTENA